MYIEKGTVFTCFQELLILITCLFAHLLEMFLLILKLRLMETERQKEFTHFSLSTGLNYRSWKVLK